MQKLLTFDKNIIPQETGWWCGPASVQVALSCRGITKTEHSLMLKLERLEGNVNGCGEVFDDRDGTDNIRQVTAVLNDELRTTPYATVQTNNDPMTATQRAKFDRDVVQSIDAGYAVVMNWVSPPGNRPVNSLGGTSPWYGNGWIYHYVTVTGYQQVNGVLHLRIADSGFSPYVYWVTAAKAASLITPKGYSAALNATTAPVPTTPTGLTTEVLSEAMGNALPLSEYAKLLPHTVDALHRAGCNTVDRVAMFFAQIGHESGGLRYFEEIASGAAYEGRKDLGNVYAGDGKRFKGRGPIQVTGRYNYGELSKWAKSKGYVPTATYFVDNPEKLSTYEYGFLGAIWYWTVARNMNSYADRRDIEGATRAVNGGTNGLADRKARYERCLKLGNKLLPQKGLTVSDINEIIKRLDRIEHQLGPKLPSWGEASSAGKNEKGEELTFRDGVLKYLRAIEKSTA